ncbi:MAG: DUF493 domain-containing protein, partial [Cyclobacteriaceae bacterium]|nr:DUF493 domain-containing protein [Cyclobacteriaceae bacterium]
MDSDEIKSFREKLEKGHQWPALYMFKFVAPRDKVEEVKELFENHGITERPSSKGNYISVTVKMMAGSSNDIIGMYLKAHKIKG